MAKNYIFEYYQQIKEEKVNVGQWIKLLYEKIIEGLENKSFFYDQKKANRAIKFIESYCHHSKGRNDLLKLELWQKALVSLIFGIVDEKGLRQFNEVVLVVARKNGKSLLASAIMAYVAYADEAESYGKEIYCVAPKLEQAEIIYNCFWQTTQYDTELSSRIKSKKTGYYIQDSNTWIKKIAFDAKRSDGLNPSLVIEDEISSWVGANGKKVHEVLRSGMGARQQNLQIAVSTAGYENEGIYDELFLRGTKYLLGDSKETKLLPVFYTIDDVDKWNDINEIAKANPNLGISVGLDYMLSEIAIAEGSLSKKSEFITKYCNLKQNSTNAWLPVKAVEKCCSEEELTFEKFKSHYCIAGIDLSQTTDLTSACLVVEDNGEFYVISHFWLPSEKLGDATVRDGIPYQEMIQKGFLSPSGVNFIDYHDVFDWLRNAVESAELLPLCVGYDRYSAQYLVQDLDAYGFKTDSVHQGHNLSPILREMEGLIRDGKVHIGNNTLLKIHLLDAALENDSRLNKVKLAKATPKAHIDGVAALSDAFCVRQKWYAEIGEQLKNN